MLINHKLKKLKFDKMFPHKVERISNNEEVLERILTPNLIYNVLTLFFLFDLPFSYLSSHHGDSECKDTKDDVLYNDPTYDHVSD